MIGKFELGRFEKQKIKKRDTVQQYSISKQFETKSNKMEQFEKKQNRGIGFISQPELLNENNLWINKVNPLID